MTQFDPAKVILNFGPLPLRGVAPGTFFSVAFQGEGAQSFVGAAGESVIVKSHDKRGTITARLMATGAGRNTLAALVAHFNAGNFNLPISLNSRETGEQLAAGTACIKQLPAPSYGTEAPVREIVFEVPELRLGVAPEV